MDFKPYFKVKEMQPSLVEAETNVLNTLFPDLTYVQPNNMNTILFYLTSDYLKQTLVNFRNDKNHTITV